MLLDLLHIVSQAVSCLETNSYSAPLDMHLDHGQELTTMLKGFRLYKSYLWFGRSTVPAMFSITRRVGNVVHVR